MELWNRKKSVGRAHGVCVRFTSVHLTYHCKCFSYAKLHSGWRRLSFFLKSRCIQCCVTEHNGCQTLPSNRFNLNHTITVTPTTSARFHDDEHSFASAGGLDGTCALDQGWSHAGWKVLDSCFHSHTHTHTRTRLLQCSPLQLTDNTYTHGGEDADTQLTF